MKDQPNDKSYINNISPPNSFMYTPREVAVGFMALAYSWWET